ncbi:MAG: LysR family transcriptional regulator [Firmicutes bacterium]|nr:LysR family transcriptional regulator [Bacillota bacterium]
MLQSLRVFCLVAHHGSFTQAAAVAGLTRPAVSRHIKLLEAHFGVQLLTRTTRRVALTPAGQRLLEHAHRVLAAYRELEAAMAALRGEGRRVLVIGASTVPGERLLPRYLAALREWAPDLEVQVRVANTETVLRWVRDGAVDLGLVGVGVGVDDPLLASRTIAEDEVVLVRPPGMPLPSALEPRELRRLPLILREAGSATRQTVLAALARVGLTPEDLRVVAELDSPEAIKAAVRSGAGCAFFSRWSLAPGELPVVRLVGVDLRRSITACWRRDRPLPEGAAVLLSKLGAAGGEGNAESSP